MAYVKWIKIATDIFDDEKILLIENLPEKYAIITCWFKLLCLAGKQNNSGVFLMNDKIAYTDEMLSTIFRMHVNTVRLSLQTFQNFGMIELIEGVITIPNWDKHQQLDALENKREYMKKYMAEKRANQKQIACKTNSKTNSKTNVNSLDKDIDIEEDKYIDIEEDINNNILSVSEETNIKVMSVFSTWNQCKSVIKHKEVTDARKKAIEKALKNYSVELIIAAINHYDIILTSKWYFKYKWSLEDFLNQKNAMPTFMDDGSNWCSFNEDLKKNPYLIPQAEPQREVSQSVKDFLKSIK